MHVGVHACTLLGESVLTANTHEIYTAALT